MAIAPPIVQGTGAVPSLYSHKAQSQDQDSASIPKPFKSTRGKGGKKSGKDKSKSQQQSQPPLPPPEQEEQYEEVNNYYQNKNYRGNNRGHRSYRGQCSGRKPYRESQHRGRGQQNNYRGQYQGNCGQFNTSHISYNNNYYGNYQGRGGRGHGGNNFRPQVVGEAIIEAIVITNTINITHMMMDHRLNNMAHRAHFAVVLIILLNIALKEKMTLIISGRK